MKQRPLALLAGFALGAALFASLATAQTLYKLIDKDGKVTYSEKPPKDFGGKVPTAEYQKKLAALEENVKKAEEELRVAEGR